jgi:hypothetical protein
LSDVKNFLKTLPDFFKFFPHFRRRKLYGAVAGMSVDENVARYAYKHGLFVLAPAGENMQILNDKKFVPRAFNGAEEKKAAKGKKQVASRPSAQQPGSSIQPHFPINTNPAHDCGAAVSEFAIIFSLASRKAVE